MSDTPRTDGAEINAREGYRVAVSGLIPAEHARTLERELNQARKIAWDWAQGVTDAETAIRQLNRMFPIDGQPVSAA